MTIATLTVRWLNRRWDDLLAVLGGIYPNTSWSKERNSPGSEKRMYGFRKDRIGTSVFASGLSSERMRCAMESFSSEVFDEFHPEAVLVGGDGYHRRCFRNLPILLIDISADELRREMQLVRMVEQIGRKGKSFERFVAVVRVVLSGRAVKTWWPIKEKQS